MRGNLIEFFDKYYSDMCKAALDRFCDMFWPCSYTDRRGRRCCNMKAGHGSKGHQDQHGNIIGARGSVAYQSSFSSTQYFKKWVSLIKSSLFSCEARLQQRSHATSDSVSKVPMTDEALRLHVEEHLKDFFIRAGGAMKYFSMATCYCCLMNVPEHPLPCGHVICTPCIKGYGTALDQSLVRMDCCPLHPEETEKIGPWIIRFKPDFAGVRVLSLDG